MNYRERDNRRKQKSRLKYIVSIGLLIIFIVLANFFFPHFLSPLTHFVGTPFFNSEASVSNTTSGFWGMLHSKQKLIQENQNLEQQLALLNEVTLERDTLQKENDDLKAMLGRATSTSPGKLAYIMSKPGFSPYDTFIINAGYQDNVHTGDLVFSDSYTIIGQIASVDAHTSNVVLYSSSDQKSTVLIGPQAIETTATGLGGGVFEVKLPQNISVSNGDTVSFSNLPDKILGSVTEITANPSDSFEEILFRSPVDISALKYVTIIPLSTNHASSTSNHH